LSNKKINAPKLLDRKTVLERVPLSYATIWKMMRVGTFPRSRDIGGKCAWLEHEISKWIADRPKVQLKDLTPKERAQLEAAQQN
jgi:prophage regulatory protein